MPKKTFTLDQVKKAFWGKFHECGELWFNYLGNIQENTETTQAEWEDFVDELEKNAQEKRQPPRAV